MLRVSQTDSFDKMYEDLCVNNPKLELEIQKRIGWFKKNPQDTRLQNHALLNRMLGKFAFSITGDIRIVYEWIGKNTVRFLAIGGHKKVYKKQALN